MSLEPSRQRGRARSRLAATGRARRALIAVGLICGSGLMVLIAAAGASAASLVYVKGGDVWIASPDGSVQRQITTDGGSGSGGYGSPTETDAGVIVADKQQFFYRFHLDGSSAGGPWTSGDFTCGSLSSSPFSAQVSPGGGLIVYDYIKSNPPCPGGSIRRRVAFANSDSYTAAGSYPTFSDMKAPRWIPGEPYAAMVNQIGTEIRTEQAAWLIPCAPQPCSPYFTSFDISRSGWRVLVAEIVTESASQADLELWDNNAPPPDGSHGTSVCSLVNWADWNSAPRWSPDGSQIAWATSAGVFVSPAPVNDGAGHCVLRPTLVVPGGYQPDWGTQNVPGSTPGPTPDPTLGSGSRQGPIVTNVAQSRRTWRAGRRLAAFARRRTSPVGTSFSFALNEPASVVFAFTRQLAGRKVKGRCFAQTKKNRRKRVCKRTVTQGRLSFKGHSGPNRVSFQGRISRSKKLKPGRYTLIITATNAAAQPSIPKRLSFTIVK